jgi:DNA-binding MarR family transcriptional regulator
MNSTTPPPEARRILDAIRRLVRSLRLYSSKVEARLGLSAAQIFVLRELDEAAPMSLKELARRTMTDVSSVSVVVDRLAQKGLVLRERSKVDGRRLDLCLSNQGNVLLREEPAAVQHRLIHAAAGLRGPQRKALAKGLEDLLAAAGMAHEEPAMLFEPEEQ